MQRWTTVAVGVLFAAVIGVAIFKGRPPPEKRSAPVTATPVSKPTPSASASTEPKRDGGEGEHAGFDTLPDGGPIAELSASAPKAVSFGVILFMYQGSQAAPKDAPTREQALERARALVPDAKKDFNEAIKKGDRGSTGDAGRIPRGVLEPAVEYVLFSLEKDAVFPEPVDTPRGFWIIKRTN